MPVVNGTLKLTLDATTFETLVSDIPDHSSTHEAGGTDEIKIDALGTPSDNTNLNASTSTHGLLPKLSGTETEFLNGDGEWSVPNGSGAALEYPGSTSVFLNGDGLWSTPNVLHASTHKTGGTDVIRLDEFGAPTTTTLNVTVTRPGLVPTLPGSKLLYLDGTGNFSSPDTSWGTRGSTAISSGTTSTSVTHGLTGTPYIVNLTPTSDTGGKRYWVSAKTSTTFTISIDSSYASNISFDWVAVGTTESGGGEGTLAEYLNVGSGYAYATDGTNDNVQIQEAIDDAVAGDIVYIHSGTYNINEPMTMKDGVTIRGDGVSSTILFIPTASLSNFNITDYSTAFFEGYNLKNATLYGMKLDGNDQDDSRIGKGYHNGVMLFNGGENFTCHDMYMTKLNNDGIKTYGYGAANIYNLQIKRCGHDGLRAQGVSNWKISNIQVDIYINYGIRFSEATNCEISYSTFTGLVGSGSAALGLDDSAPGLKVHHNRFHDINTSTTRNGILATSGTGAVTVYNNVFYKCYDGGIRATNGDQTFNVYQNVFDTNAYAVSDLAGATLTNNIITNCTSYAVRGISGYCTLSGNNIYGGSTTVTNASVSGTLTGAPGYNATSLQFIPLQSSAPLYSVLSGWTTAGYTA